MLRPKEVCQCLGVSYQTLREYVNKDYIKTSSTIEWEIEIQKRGC